MSPAVEPDGGSAHAVAAIVSVIHGLPVGPDDDIFVMGLNSLDLVRIIGGIEHEFGVRLSAIDILDNPTPRLIAAALGGQGQAPGEPDDRALT